MTFNEWYAQGSKITKLGWDEMGDYLASDLKLAYEAGQQDATRNIRWLYDQLKEHDEEIMRDKDLDKVTFWKAIKADVENAEKGGKEEIVGQMDEDTYAKLKYLDNLKH